MRIVIKIGTNLLTAKNGSLDKNRMDSLAREISCVKKSGSEVVIVTSGAIGAGMGKMKISERPQELPEKQALAAIGQPILMQAYNDVFEKYGLTAGQILITRHDFEDRQRYLNARNTLLKLLAMGIVPVINENDTTAVEGIKFGENDTLSALVAAKISADVLLILTDVDGLYKGAVGKSEIIKIVENITKEIEGLATGSSSSGKGVGGMRTKLSAAKIAVSSGVKVYIANGLKEGVITKIVSGESIGTLFPAKKGMDARKCWIAFGTKSKGRIIIDDGAVKAIKDGKKSLLASGITGVSGSFEEGDSASIVDKNGEEIARGLPHFSSAQIEKIKGRKTSEIKKLVPEAGFEEVIHRDNLVVL